MPSCGSSSRTASRYYFRDVRGFAYDEVNAAMAAGWSDLVDLRSAPDARAAPCGPRRISSRWPPASNAFRIFSSRRKFTGGGAVRAGTARSRARKQDLYARIRAHAQRRSRIEKR